MRKHLQFWWEVMKIRNHFLNKKSEYNIEGLYQSIMDRVWVLSDEGREGHTSTQDIHSLVPLHQGWGTIPTSKAV